MQFNNWTNAFGSAGLLGAGAANTTTFATPITYPEPQQSKVEVPIISRSDKAGIFLRGEHGELIHVSAERLYKSLGIEW